MKFIFRFVSKTPTYLLEKSKPNEITKNETPNAHWPKIIILVWNSLNFENHTEMLHHTKVTVKGKETEVKVFLALKLRDNN